MRSRRDTYTRLSDNPQGQSVLIHIRRHPRRATTLLAYPDTSTQYTHAFTHLRVRTYPLRTMYTPIALPSQQPLRPTPPHPTTYQFFRPHIPPNPSTYLPTYLPNSATSHLPPSPHTRRHHALPNLTRAEKTNPPHPCTTASSKKKYRRRKTEQKACKVTTPPHAHSLLPTYVCRLRLEPRD